MEDLTFWHWFIFGLAMVILEMFAPGAIFLWIGAAAGVVGAVLYFIPSLTWENQFMIFAVLSVASIVLSKMFFKKHPIETDSPTLNRRGEQNIGRVFTLTEAIVNGVGKVKVDDTIWKVAGADRDIGHKVKVVAADGNILMVEPAD